MIISENIMHERSVLIGVLLFAVLTIFSCGRPLEDIPLERLSLGEVYDSKDSAGTYANYALAQVYSYLPEGYMGGGNLLATMTDDAVPSDKSSTEWGIVTKGYTPFLNPMDDWVTMYQAIRAATICYKNIGVVPYQNADLRQAYPAEARFLRAFYYFQLVKRYGGVPLLGDSVRNIDDNLAIPRSSFTDCINYIVNELDSCIPKLRPEPLAGSESGHATKGWAMALKAKVLLYAASPLNNPDNDLTLWKKAADAAEAVINSGYYALENNFKDIFTTNVNKEIIVYRHFSNGYSLESANGPAGYISAGNGAATSPTQELVDAFGMSNGLPITDPASGYDPDNPYSGRDPRFYYTILYNGAQWLGRPVETYENGLDKPNSGIIQTQTGYYLRKMLGDFENERKFSSHPINMIFIRYAGILLDYAEALNEYEGPVPEVYDQLIALRKRAGIEAGEDGMYGLKAGMTQSEMRQVIRNERRVELAFEDQRFWDIRRWKIAGDVYNKPLHGMDISLYPATGELTYKAEPVVTPLFLSPKMYHFPISYNVLTREDGLEQDPDWK